MTTTQNDEDIVVTPETRMEEGTLQDDAIPVAATAVMAEPVDDTAADHALTGSNRFVPVAVASALPDHAPFSSPYEEEEEERPDLLSATVYKSSPSAKTGIALIDTTNVGVTVKRVEPAGLFGVSSFQVGDRLMSVNNESCEGLDSKGVADLIRNAEGIVTVVVRARSGRSDRVSSMVMKESPDARVGIGFIKRGGKIVISSIAEDGIFAHSLLNVSDTCLSINGVACTSNTDVTTAAESIRAAPSFVTIMAKTRHETGVVVAASKVSGPTIVSNTAGTGGASTAVATVAAAGRQAAEQQQQDPAASQKRGCAVAIGVFAIIVVIIVVLMNGSDDYDYYGSCQYLYCTQCGYDCYSEA